MEIKSRKIKLPGIGMRIIKSALSVVICMLVNLLRGDSGMVFYSQLAALWCIQMYRTNTMKNAFQRFVGTIVGAIYGLIYILFYPQLENVTNSSYLIETLGLFIFIVLVIYTTVLIHKNQASYFSCVVFLSIVINHIGDANPYLFVFNRFLDTIIGIGIGLFVNNLRISLKPDRNTLFVSGVDDMLTDHDDNMSSFSIVEINRMIDDGMRFTLSTMRTPASLQGVINNIHLKYPVIVMDGAALFDTVKNEYVNTYIISSNTATEVFDIIHQSGLCAYVNVIIDDTLLIYYQDTNDEINTKLVNKLKVSPYRNYLNRKYPGDENVIYFMVLDKTKKVDSFYDSLIELGYGEKLKILKYPSDDYDGYSYIKIYNKNASKENMLSYLKEKYNISQSVTFGTMEGKYDVLVPENSFNDVVRMVRKRYEPFIK